MDFQQAIAQRLEGTLASDLRALGRLKAAEEGADHDHVGVQAWDTAYLLRKHKETLGVDEALVQVRACRRGAYGSYVGCLLHSVAYGWCVACCATVLHTLGAVAYSRETCPTHPVGNTSTNAQLGCAAFGIPSAGPPVRL